MDAVCDTAKKHALPPVWRGHGYCAQPGWFGPEDRARFGWLYRPDRSNRTTAVVVVPPFGGEDICAHRTVRHLAEASARSGFVTARFDLDGCGDSVGDDSEPDRIENWITSVLDACDLVRSTGADGVVLVGLRLGAALATLAAQRRDDVVASIAFNAVIRGSSWLHELRAFQAAMNLRSSPVAANEDSQEAVGFLLSPNTCNALHAIDLTRSAAPAARVLMLERDDLPGSDDWHDHLLALGCQVERQRIPGYAEMMIDAHRNRVAQAFIDACIGYLHNIPISDKCAFAAPAMPLRNFATLQVGNACIEETVVSPGAGIFGILARRRQSNADRALLVLNAGAVRHIGVGRFDVGFARQMAASGSQVLRIDLTGIGDSPARAGACENLAYAPEGVNDVEVCVRWLRARGVRELIIGGMCSGASHALRATLAGQPIDAAYLVNCGLFGHEFDPVSHRRFGDIAHYNKSMKSARSWRKLLSGNVDVRRVARAAAWKLALQSQGLLRGAARRAGVPVRGDLSRDFAALARRGVKLHFLYSGNDPGLVRLAVETGSLVPKYCRGGRFSLRTFAGANHTFTQRWAQASLLLALQQILTPNMGTAAISEVPLSRPSDRAH